MPPTHTMVTEVIVGITFIEGTLTGPTGNQANHPCVDQLPQSSRVIDDSWQILIRENRRPRTPPE